ncbi:35026_t:CDS:2, partial [Gigaspora margarita]
NNLPKLSLEPRIGSAPFEENEPDGSEKHRPFEIQVRNIHEQRQFKSLTNIENEEEKDIEESKVENHLPAKATSHPNNPFPVTPGLVYHTYPCFSPPKIFKLIDIGDETNERHWSLRRGDKEKKYWDNRFLSIMDMLMAQILRSPDEKQVVVSLPQKPKKTVKLRLQQRSNSLLTVEPCVQENSLHHSESAQGSNIHQQFITAQKKLFLKANYLT